MCLAIPGKVIEKDGDAAVVEVFGVTRRVSINFVPTVALGDYVMLHAGCAIEVMDVEEAERTLELFAELGFAEACADDAEAS
jgi:hydrogenase expression/formation protein HypC